MDRPPQQRVQPGCATAPVMDALVRAAQARGRVRDVAIFALLRFTGMRRESVAMLRVNQLDGNWGLRGVLVKGGTVRDIPVPASVMDFLHGYVQQVLIPSQDMMTPDAPLFWSTWGRRTVGKIRRPMTGKNIWRLCK
jgi:site-specific recombinase XerD